MTPAQAQAELARRELTRRAAISKPAEAPSEDSGGIDYGAALNEAGRAAINPGPEDMARGGFDVVQRAAQAGGNNIYSQGRKLLVNAVPQKTRENIGHAIQSIPLNPVSDVASLLPAQKVGDETVGLGVDTAVGLASDAVTGPATTVIGKLLKGIGGISEEAGGRLMNSYIKPRQAAFSFGRNPGRAVAKHIGPQMTREGLYEAVGNKKDELLNQLSESVKANNGNAVDVSPIFKNIGDVLQYMDKMPNTYKEQISAHEGLFTDLANMIKQKSTVKNGKIYINPGDAVELKRAIGQIPSWTANDPRLGTLTKTTRKAYGAFDKEIDKAVPGSAETNQDISDLIGAQKGIELGMQRTQNKDPLGLLDTILGGLGFTKGGPAGAVGGYALSKTIKGAPFNTTVSSAAGNFGKVAKGAGAALEEMEGPGLIRGLLKKGKKSGISVRP